MSTTTTTDNNTQAAASTDQVTVTTTLPTIDEAFVQEQLKNFFYNGEQLVKDFNANNAILFSMFVVERYAAINQKTVTLTGEQKKQLAMDLLGTTVKSLMLQAVSADGRAALESALGAQTGDAVSSLIELIIMVAKNRELVDAAKKTATGCFAALSQLFTSKKK